MRDTVREDYIRDAHVFAVLLHLFVNLGHDAVGTEEFERAMAAHVRLLKIEGVNLSDLFYGDEHVEIETRNALSTAVRIGAIFRKTRNDGRVYFERSFRTLAEREMRQHIDQSILPSINAVLETTARVCMHDRDWQSALERIEEYKRKKEAGIAAATK